MRCSFLSTKRGKPVRTPVNVDFNLRLSKAASGLEKENRREKGRRVPAGMLKNLLA